jgi:Condensation domain
MSNATPNPASDVPALERRKPEEPRVASFSQLRLWYLEQLSPGTAVYNVPYLMKIRGPLDVAALRQAYDGLVGRHEVLRTVFLAPAGKPMPFVLKKWAVQITEIDLRHLPPQDREIEADRLIREAGAKPFNLARDATMRGLVLRMEDVEFLFLQIAHHISFEAGGLAVAFEELAALYQASLKGQPATLPDPPFQYCDFAALQRRMLQGERLAQLAQFWRQHLTGAAEIQLSVDHPRPARWSHHGKRHPIAFPMPLLRDLQTVTADCKTTIYRSTLAAFNVFLHARTGQSDFSVGSPVLPRSVNVEGMIGFFVNTVVFRNDLSGDPSFREIMTRVDRSCRASLQHSDLTLDKVVEAVQPPRDPTRTPLFQVNFRAPKGPPPVMKIEGLEITPPVYRDNGTSKFDLAFELWMTTGEGSYIEYCSDLFEPSTIERMRDDFERLLQELVSRPGAKLSELATVRAMRQHPSRNK